MATDVIMPQMGADMTEGTIVRWVKQVGEDVKRGDVIAEIETDKATVELEAFDAGVLKKQIFPEGEIVPVGQVIALLGTADEVVDSEPEQKQRTAPAERKLSGREGKTQARASADAAEPSTREADAPSGDDDDQTGDRASAASTATAEAPPQPAGTEGDGRVRISPVARRIAEDAGLEATAVRGTGPDGRILRRDVEAAIASRKEGQEAPSSEQAAAAGRPQEAAPRAWEGAVELQPLSRMRQTIARRMQHSKQQQPHYYLTLDIDMTAALAFREQINAAASDEERVSINDLVVKAAALALARHPKFNAEYSEEGLKLHGAINIDLGIALDEGLIAPAILDCGNKSLGKIAVEAKALIERARSGKLRADEYSAGTFSITNLGAYGVETLIGIIKPPQAAILGVGSVMPKAIAQDGEVAIRQVMKVALSADHRVSDGAEGARFIKEIQAVLENPASMAL